MSAENQDRARLIVPGDPRMPPDRSAGELRHVVTLALDAAELRGFDRAVQETAIHSVHKAVAAERAAVVAWLREWASVGRVAHADDYADEIEAGDHHPKEQA